MPSLKATIAATLAAAICVCNIISESMLHIKTGTIFELQIACEGLQVLVGQSMRAGIYSSDGGRHTWNAKELTPMLQSASMEAACRGPACRGAAGELPAAWLLRTLATCGFIVRRWVMGLT